MKSEPQSQRMTRSARQPGGQRFESSPRRQSLISGLSPSDSRSERPLQARVRFGHEEKHLNTCERIFERCWFGESFPKP